MQVAGARSSRAPIWCSQVFRWAFLPAAINLLVTSPLWPQADTSRVRISGFVVDPMRQPIEGAEVRLAGTAIGTFSARDGAFSLMVPRAKESLVQVRRPGFRAQLLKFDGRWVGTVLLEPGRYELPEISVTARYAKPAAYAATYKYDEVFRRRRIGLGQFVSRDEIDKRGATEVGQLLEGKAGIRVSINPLGAGTSVVFARCNPPKINGYLDGRKLIPRISDGYLAEGLPQAASSVRSLVGEMLDRVAVSDVEMIEIFRGPGELPGDFNDGNCGAISIWTRQGAR